MSSLSRELGNDVTARATSRRKRRTYAARVPVEHRRAQLLDAALHLVVTRGHNAATMEAVAEAAGVTKPVVYAQFGNRAELLAALLHREQQQGLAQLLATMPGDLAGHGRDAGDQVAGVLAGFLHGVREHPDRWHCIVMPMPDMPAEFHHAREAGRKVAITRMEDIAGRLRDHIAAPPALDAEILAHTLVSLLEMAARLVLTDPDHFRPERFEAALRAAVGLTRQS